MAPLINKLNPRAAVEDAVTFIRMDLSVEELERLARAKRDTPVSGDGLMVYSKASSPASNMGRPSSDQLLGLVTSRLKG